MSPTAAIEPKALLAAPRDAKAPASSVLVEVAREHGISPLRQMREMFALAFGPARLALADYHTYGMFDPDIPMPAKKEYVGARGSYLINARLNLDDLTISRGFVGDKVMYTALLRQLGLPTTRTQAVASVDRGFGDIPALRDPGALKTWLLNDAAFPLFGKPCEGRGSVGSALFSGIEEAQIVMGNGRRADLDGFCAEVFTDYPEGFIFQTALRQHDDLTRIAGPSIGTMRVVTIRDGDGIRVLYTVWKVPAPDAMSDNFWQKGSMVVEVDPAGVLGRCRIGTGLEGRWINAHPVSGEEFAGRRVPHWSAIMEAARAGHALFPEFGVVGWDIAVTPEGPVLIECNDNPFHALWQLANGRGIRNAEFMAAFDKVAATSTAILEGKVAVYKQRQRAKGRRG